MDVFFKCFEMPTRLCDPEHQGMEEWCSPMKHQEVVAQTAEPMHFVSSRGALPHSGGKMARDEAVSAPHSGVPEVRRADAGLIISETFPSDTQDDDNAHRREMPQRAMPGAGEDDARAANRRPLTDTRGDRRALSPRWPVGPRKGTRPYQGYDQDFGEGAAAHGVVESQHGELEDTPSAAANVSSFSKPVIKEYTAVPGTQRMALKEMEAKTDTVICMITRQTGELAVASKRTKRKFRWQGPKMGATTFRELFGPGTDPIELSRFTNSMSCGYEVKALLLCYRGDVVAHPPFYAKVRSQPLYNDDFSPGGNIIEFHEDGRTPNKHMLDYLAQKRTFYQNDPRRALVEGMDRDGRVAKESGKFRAIAKLRLSKDKEAEEDLLNHPEKTRTKRLTFESCILEENHTMVGQRDHNERRNVGASREVHSAKSVEATATKNDLKSLSALRDLIQRREQREALLKATSASDGCEGRPLALRRDLDSRGVLKTVAPAYGKDVEDRLDWFVKEVKQQVIEPMMVNGRE
mmetsp:Transcript_65108/g.154219  ORF Transcript_65108/g.154219 Transcript_65108/m.154219 type:complete len:520 (+) Transcript_65108:99-1658(+)